MITPLMDVLLVSGIYNTSLKLFVLVIKQVLF